MCVIAGLTRNLHKGKESVMGNDAYVYFMANANNRVLYVGVTNNLERRVWEYKNRTNSNSFTGKYKCHKLVYFEHTNDMEVAIAREKQLKDWKREWKNELIEKKNPQWRDLSIENDNPIGDCGSSPQ